MRLKETNPQVLRNFKGQTIWEDVGVLITNRSEIITPDFITALGPKPHPVPGAERTVPASSSLIFYNILPASFLPAS